MRLGISILALAFLGLCTPLQASIIAGHDYVVLTTPQRQESNGKIEVVEFFSWDARIAMSSIRCCHAGLRRFPRMPVSSVFRWA